MQTEIKNLSDVELQLEIVATFDDMKDDLEKALRAQRTRTTMKGFRPGKVPASMVQKIYGKALAYGVAEDLVQRTFQEEVIKDGKYDVLGQPTITDLEFDYDTKGNLTATVGFGIRPAFELADMSKTEIRKLVHTVEDDEIEKEVHAMLESRAEFSPEEGPATETSYVVVDLERVDENGETIEGSRQEAVPFLLSDENLMPSLRDGLKGAEVGQTVDVKFPAHDSDEERSYKMTVKEIKRRELPELTDELAKELTNGQLESADALRAEIRKQVESGWKKRQTEMFESDVVEALIAKHEFLIPASVVEMYQDAYVKELKSRQKDDKLPANFDVEAYKESRREEAEDQARWMFIRDAIIEKHNLEVSEEQMDAHYAQMAEEGGFPAEMMKQYYQSMPQMLQNVRERMLSEQVFNTLASEMKVTEVDLETYRKKAGK